SLLIKEVFHYYLLKFYPSYSNKNTTYADAYFEGSLDADNDDGLLERAGDDGDEREVVAIVILPSTTHLAPPNSLPPGPCADGTSISKWSKVYVTATSLSITFSITLEIN